MLHFVPLAQLTERQLMAETKISRTPLREALLRLEADGLLTIRQRAGITIAPLNRRAWQQVTALRKQLMPQVLTAMLENDAVLSGLDLRDLGTAFQKAGINGGIRAHLAAEATFNNFVLSQCGNPFLQLALKAPNHHAQRFWVRFLGERYVETSAAHYARAIGAMLEGDIATAKDLMQNHFDEVESEIARL